jgi:probable addiction module antidote protein
VARDAGVSRESLYRALSGESNPEFGTILKVMRALGLKLVTQPARTDPEDD